jgi:hypothetical protein
MDSIEFLVQGSERPYEVVFKKMGKGVLARCACAASRYGAICKHRLRILSGDDTDIISENTERLLTEVQDMISGTKVEKLLKEYLKAEAEMSKVKIIFDQKKKELTNALILKHE